MLKISIKWAALGAAHLLLVFNAKAASTSGEFVVSLLECSPKYFSQIVENLELSSEHQFSIKGRVIVPNSRDELGTGFMVFRKNPIQIAGFTVVGMYDLQRKFNTFESYDWGLLVKGDPSTLIDKSNALLPSSKSLESDNVIGFARLEKTTIKAWPKWIVQKPLPPSNPVEFGEFQMLAEITMADETLPGVSRMGCSLQGVFPPFVLRQMRPDIN